MFQILVISTLKSYSPPLHCLLTNLILHSHACTYGTMMYNCTCVCSKCNVIFKKTVLAVSRLARAPSVRWSQFTLLRCSLHYTSCIQLNTLTSFCLCIILDAPKVAWQNWDCKIDLKWLKHNVCYSSPQNKTRFSNTSLNLEVHNMPDSVFEEMISYFKDYFWFWRNGIPVRVDICNIWT